MERRRTTIAPTSWLESPQGRLSDEEEPKIQGGQAAALVITVLAILMMVVM
jgi:hypothetical protein